jgi:cholesterol oxidase
MYSLDTVDTNLVEHLVEHGFDVWLLDHRLSIALPASKGQSTLDDVATKDYPAAVAAVLELTGSSSLQVVCHGVGSSTFTMAMLAGLQGVRSAVCSQVSTDLLVPAVSRAKARLRMPDILRRLGAKSVTAYTDTRAAWASRLYNVLLGFYPMPAEERCGNPVCKRITGIYGHLYEHDQLNGATHAALHELFGHVNLTALGQLSLLSLVGHLVNASGEEVYLAHLKRMAIPVALLHGGENICVLPRSTELTLDRLSAENGADFYVRHLISNYGHVDCMLGKNAARDVFPLISEHLAST